MKRLAAMQDCPLFCTCAVTAVRTQASRSADGNTMNGSDSAELEDALLQGVTGGCRDGHAGALAAGDRDGGDAGVVDEVGDVLGLDEEVGENAFW